MWNQLVARAGAPTATAAGAWALDGTGAGAGAGTRLIVVPPRAASAGAAAAAGAAEAAADEPTAFWRFRVERQTVFGPPPPPAAKEGDKGKAEGKGSGRGDWAGVKDKRSGARALRRQAERDDRRKKRAASPSPPPVMPLDDVMAALRQTAVRRALAGDAALARATPTPAAAPAAAGRGATTLVTREPRAMTWQERYLDVLRHPFDPSSHPAWPGVALSFAVDGRTGRPDFEGWTNVAALQALRASLVELSNAAERHAMAPFWGCGPSYRHRVPYEDDIDAVNARIEALEAPAGWRAALHQGTFADLLGDTPADPGSYRRVLASPKPFVPIGEWASYAVVRDEWRRADASLDTWDAWWDAFDADACTDWAKMDTTGKSYGGPWEERDADGNARDDAWDVCRRANAEALFRMPYPRRVVLFVATHWGCGNRCESVPYTRAVCEWVARVEAALRRDEAWGRRRHAVGVRTAGGGGA